MIRHSTLDRLRSSYKDRAKPLCVARRTLRLENNFIRLEMSIRITCIKRRYAQSYPSNAYKIGPVARS